MRMSSRSKLAVVFSLAGLGLLATAVLTETEDQKNRDTSGAASADGRLPVRTIGGRTAAALGTAPVAPGAMASPPQLPPPTEGARVVPDELIVVLHDTDAETVAPRLARLGLRIVDTTPDGRALRLATPSGAELSSLSAAAAAVPGVSHAGPNGIIRGANSEYRRAQWHLDGVATMNAGTIEDNVPVAVFDTGVGVGYGECQNAHGNNQPWGGTVPGLVVPRHRDHTPIGWNFWDGQPCGVDDHQHGTHIASLIGSDDYLVDGVAPGVEIVPVKVLNSNNQGHEFGLITALQTFSQALDMPTGSTLLLGETSPRIINMSLSFAPDYLPSPALQHWLHTLYSQGILIVAASGNDGIDQVSWPAAHPDVLAVGAVCALPGGGWERAPYSNAGPVVDLVAPGGCIDRDTDGDGMADGLLASSIDQQNHEPGLWQMAGTSQAAALVSGAAATVISDWPEASPDAVRWVLQSTARDVGDDNWKAGLGAGLIQVGATAAAIAAPEVPADFTRPSVGVGLVPYLRDNGDGTVTPVARVAAFTEAGARDPDANLMVRISGSSSTLEVCSTKRWTDNVCIIEGAPVLDTGDKPLAWSVAVPQARIEGWTARTHTVLFASDDLDNALGELEEAGLGNVPFGYYFDTEVAGPQDGELWLVQHGSVSIVNNGTGLASSPLGIVGNPPFAQGLGTLGGASTMDVEMRTMDGTGLASSPLGIQLLTLDNNGGQLALIDGTGLASSPLGIQQIQLNQGMGCPTCAIDGMMVSPSMEVLDGAAAAQLPFLADRIDGTGQMTALGVDPATAVATSVDHGTSVSLGSNTGAVPFVTAPAEGRGEGSGGR